MSIYICLSLSPSPRCNVGAYLDLDQDQNGMLSPDELQKSVSQEEWNECISSQIDNGASSACVDTCTQCVARLTGNQTYVLFRFRAGTAAVL